MANFNYEWWTVDVKTPVGVITMEFKGKDRAHVVKQIEKEVRYSNSNENLTLHWTEQHNQILEVYWDTLTLDRVGYQRLS